MKPNIDLTEDRDFNKDGFTRTRDTLTGDVNNIVGLPRVERYSSDEFVRRFYRSDFLNYLFDNQGNICDRCGKRDYFNQMKFSLCNKCDEAFDVYKIEVFPTGNREMIQAKKEKWKSMNRLENRLADIGGDRGVRRFNDRRIPWS